MEKTKSVSALLKNDMAVKIIVAVGFALIIFILFSDVLSADREAARESGAFSEAETAASYAEKIERQLAELISRIQGVGEPSVMITLESYDGNGTPRVRGVAIVCEGGDNILVKQKVVETISRVLGISTAKVSVVN